MKPTLAEMSATVLPSARAKVLKAAPKQRLFPYEFPLLSQMGLNSGSRGSTDLVGREQRKKRHSITIVSRGTPIGALSME